MNNRTHVVSMGVEIAEKCAAAPIHPRFQAILAEQQRAESRVVTEGQASAPAPLAVLVGNTLEMGTVVELGRALARLGIRVAPQWILGDDGLIEGIRFVEVAP